RARADSRVLGLGPMAADLRGGGLAPRHHAGAGARLVLRRVDAPADSLSMLEVLGSEYIKLARLKGLPDVVVIAMHAFKNALIPVFTLVGVNMVVMVNAAVIIEVIFAWPGIGRLLYEGIFNRDFPLVQGVVVMAVFLTVGINLIVDILYAFIDPRIRLTR